MRRQLLSAVAGIAIALAGACGADLACAASLTPPNLSSATTLSNNDLLLVWPYSAGGPLESMQWSVFAGLMKAQLQSYFLQPSSNLSDLASPTAARTNLGLGSAATANTGTSGNSIGLLNGTNTWSATQTFQGVTAGGLAEVSGFQNNTADAIGDEAGVDFEPSSSACKAMVTGYRDGGAGNTGLHLWACASNSRSVALQIDNTGLATFSDGVTIGNGATINGGLTLGTALSVGNGGTGATTAAAARNNLGLGSAATVTATSNSFTPTLAYQTPGSSSFSYSQQSGGYACVNGVVTAHFFISYTPTNTGASGALIISGLPYTSSNYAGTGTDGGVVTAVGSSTTYPGWLVLRVTNNSTTMTVIAETTGTGGNALGVGNIATGSSNTLGGIVTYFTSSGACS